MSMDRREFGKLAAAALLLPRAATAIDSRVGGVRLGVQTYSFRELPRAGGADAVGDVIAAMTGIGLGECELYAPQLEPARPGKDTLPAEAAKARDNLRKWRLETPLEHFRDIRKKFDAAGISIYAYNYSPDASFTDAEIDRGFEMTKALGAEIVTSSTTLDVARRIAPIAEKHRMTVAMHGHSRIDPNELASAESFASVMKLSRFFKVNLDIGHFTAANFDPVAYIREHHDSITNLHLKDRRKNQGDNTVWGEGDTAIREVLRLLKAERWPIRAYIEYEYKGAGSPIEEVRKCYEYCKRALA